MLAVILKILSILGIILLIVLCVALVVLCLLLFWPITYRFEGNKDSTSITAKFRARWLFGFARATYDYPEPGVFKVKILWFTITEQKSVSADNEQTDSQKDSADSPSPDSTVQESVKEDNTLVCDKVEEPTAPGDSNRDNTMEQPAKQNGNKDSTQDGGWFFTKIEKIKYTIRRLYDRIKHIWEELDYYKRLLEDEETKALFSHACKRIGKILRHIRPRKLKADILFGTGSPDTTGYAYGIYGMFSPQLGKDICITPNFVEPILEGRIYAAGHIMVCTLLIHSLALLLDKRLRLLIGRIKNHKI